MTRAWITPHIKFRVSDIMDLPPDYAGGCDLAYTDPPWEQGLVKMFETMAERDSGRGRANNTIDAILGRLFDLIPDGIPTFVEYATKGYERVQAIGEARGFSCTQVHAITQGNGKPYVLVQFNSDMPPLPPTTKGWAALSGVLAFHNPKCVFEPFAGHGQHARRIAATGEFVVAAEYSPSRATKLQEHFGLC